MEIDIESEALGLHGGYDRVLAVIVRDGYAKAFLGGSFGGPDDAAQLAIASASLLRRVAQELGFEFAEFMAALAGVVLDGVPHETVRDAAAEAEDAEAVRALADELGVEVPE